MAEPSIPDATGIIAYVGKHIIYGKHWGLDINKRFGVPEALPISSLQSALLKKYADEKGIIVSDEEVKEKTREIASTISDQAFAAFIKKATLVFEGLRVNLKDQQAGEAFFQEKLSSSVTREEWESWKRNNANEAELEKSQATLPRDPSDMVSRAVQGLIDQIRIKKAMSEIVGSVGRSSDPVLNILRAGPILSGANEIQAKENEAIAVIQSAVLFLWMKDQTRSSDVRIVNQSFANAIEEKSRVAEQLLGKR